MQQDAAESIKDTRINFHAENKRLTTNLQTPNQPTDDRPTDRPTTCHLSFQLETKCLYRRPTNVVYQKLKAAG